MDAISKAYADHVAKAPVIDLSGTYAARRRAALVRALHRTSGRRAASIVGDLAAQGWRGLSKAEMAEIEGYCK